MDDDAAPWRYVYGLSYKVASRAIAANETIAHAVREHLRVDERDDATYWLAPTFDFFDDADGVAALMRASVEALALPAPPEHAYPTPSYAPC